MAEALATLDPDAAFPTRKPQFNGLFDPRWGVSFYHGCGSGPYATAPYINRGVMPAMTFVGSATMSPRQDGWGVAASAAGAVDGYRVTGAAITYAPSQTRGTSLICFRAPVDSDFDTSSRIMLLYGDSAYTLFTVFQTFGASLYGGWFNAGERAIASRTGLWKAGDLVTLAVAYDSAVATKQTLYVNGVSKATGPGVPGNFSGNAGNIISIGGSSVDGNGSEWPILYAMFADRQYTAEELAWIARNPLNWMFLPGPVGAVIATVNPFAPVDYPNPVFPRPSYRPPTHQDGRSAALLSLTFLTPPQGKSVQNEIVRAWVPPPSVLDAQPQGRSASMLGLTFNTPPPGVPGEQALPDFIRPPVRWQDHQAPSRALLAVTAAPFTSTDTAHAPRPRLAPQDFFAWSSLLTTTAPLPPPGRQLDARDPAPRLKLPPQDWTNSASPALQIGLAPFRQTDWPVPKAKAPPPQDWQTQTAKALHIEQNPVGPIDFPNPAARRWPAQDFSASIFLGLTAKPFAQYDWPNPVIAGRPLPPAGFFNVNLFPAAPFWTPVAPGIANWSGITAGAVTWSPLSPGDPGWTVVPPPSLLGP